MKPISAISILAATSSLTTTPATVNADINFEINTATCNSDPFYNMDVTVTCENGENAPGCLFGDDALVEGIIEAYSPFNQNSNVTFKACIWNYCPADNIRSAGTLCGDWLTPIDNQTCGEVGLYSVNHAEIIPGSDMPNSWSWMVRAVNVVEDNDCSSSSSGGSGEYADGNSYQSTGGDSSSDGSTNHNGMTYSMVGAFIGSLFGVSYAAKKKLIWADEEDTADDFIEMTCPGVV